MIAHLPDWLVVVLLVVGLWIVVSIPLSFLFAHWLRDLHEFYPPDDD